MGLILNGIVGGNKYEDELVSADKLIDLFKLKDKFTKSKSVIRFDLHQNMTVKKDGEVFHPQQISILCLTNGTYEGDQFELQYYKTRTRKDMGTKGKADYMYAPRKIQFQGNTLAVNTENDKEMAVFLMLHTQCETSPVRKRGSRMVFTLHDPHAKALEQQKSMMAALNIYNSIANDNIESLRLIAQGMRLGNFTDKSASIVRAALFQKFEEMKAAGKMDEFIEKYESKVSTFQGIVLDAVHRGILMQVPEKGFFVYKWGVNTNKAGQLLYTVPKNQTPIESLIEFSIDNYETVILAIKDEIIKEKNRNGLDKAVDDTLKELIEISNTEEEPEPVKEEVVKKTKTIGVKKTHNL